MINLRYWQGAISPVLSLLVRNDSGSVLFVPSVPRTGHESSRCSGAAGSGLFPPAPSFSLLKLPVSRSVWVSVMIDHLLEVHEYEGEGYKPLVDFASWRVAILNYSPELLPEQLTRMQRHNETDEVFVLLQGRCLLFVGEGEARVMALHAIDLVPGRIYNVKQAVWHTHTLSADAQVLVVENRDTTYDNSPFTPLTPAQQEELIALTRSRWAERKG